MQKPWRMHNVNTTSERESGEKSDSQNIFRPMTLWHFECFNVWLIRLLYSYEHLKPLRPIETKRWEMRTSTHACIWNETKNQVHSNDWFSLELFCDRLLIRISVQVVKHSWVKNPEESNCMNLKWIQDKNFRFVWMHGNGQKRPLQYCMCASNQTRNKGSFSNERQRFNKIWFIIATRFATFQS